MLAGSAGLVATQTTLKQQTLAGNFPMRLRWNAHRLMLGQSTAFYVDEFAGRVATKVISAALAVRNLLMIVCDILVFITIYFVTLLAVVGSFDRRLLLLLPLLWLAAYLACLRFSVQQLAKVSQDQADARSPITGRITDTYNYIATVKLFPHDARDADNAVGAMAEFLGKLYTQMRLVTSFA